MNASQLLIIFVGFRHKSAVLGRFYRLILRKTQEKGRSDASPLTVSPDGVIRGLTVCTPCCLRSAQLLTERRKKKKKKKKKTWAGVEMRTGGETV